MSNTYLHSTASFSQGIKIGSAVRCMCFLVYVHAGSRIWHMRSGRDGHNWP